MMRKAGMLLLMAGMAAFVMAPVAQAAEKKSAEKKAPAKQAARPQASQDEKAKLVTEGELAQWLVRVLGLARFLPAAPTDLECFQVLMQNNIAPREGWKQDRTVTMGNLARVIVQALGKQAEVQDPDKDESWIGYLKGIGIDFGTIGEAVENLEPLPQPVGPEAIVTSTDPLGKLSRINPPDNQQIGADLSTLGRIFSQVQVPPGPPPMTPN